VVGVTAPETMPIPLAALLGRPTPGAPVARFRHANPTRPAARVRQLVVAGLAITVAVAPAHGLLGWLWMWAGTGLVAATFLVAAGVESVLT
jgi:hypothetical protein